MIFRWMRVYKELKQKTEKISELERQIKALKDENAVLWMQLDEIKEQEQAIYNQMKEELNEAILRNIEPIGSA